MQGFYFFVKSGLVLIDILKVYCTKSSSILLRKKYVQFIICIFLLESMYPPSQVMKDFSVENLETTPSTFLSKFSSDIYLSRINNYWGSIFTLYLTWGTFSLVCVLPVFFSFLLSSFFSFSIGIFLDRH